MFRELLLTRCENWASWMLVFGKLEDKWFNGLSSHNIRRGSWSCQGQAHRQGCLLYYSPSTAWYLEVCENPTWWQNPYSSFKYYNLSCRYYSSYVNTGERYCHCCFMCPCNFEYEMEVFLHHLVGSSCNYRWCI